MCKKLTATTIANLQVDEGKAYAKLFDTEVTRLGVRKTAKDGLKPKQMNVIAAAKGPLNKLRNLNILNYKLSK